MEALKATDLRIGNKILVDCDMEWEIRTIESIGKDMDGYQGYFITHEQGSVSIEDIFDDGDYLIKGIPLTPDLLMKCGFEANVDYLLQINGFSICFEKSGSNLNCYLESIGIDILYLHELQNLVKCLTGQELTVKL